MEIGGESHQPLVRRIVLEQPQPVLGMTQGVRLAALGQAELRQVQVCHGADMSWARMAMRASTSPPVRQRNP